MKYILSILSFLCILSGPVFAGEHPKTPSRTIMVSGIITDAVNNETLAGVKIACEGCQKTIYSDLDGRFFLYLQVEAKQDVKFEITQVGYVSKTLSLQEISSSTGNLKVDLISE